jgi:hypothetical protein
MAGGIMLTKFWYWLLKFFCPPEKKKRRTKKLLLSFCVSEKPFYAQGRIPMLVLTDSQFVTLNVTPVTKAGNPATIDGAPKWSVSDESVLALEVSEDGLSCKAVATGKLGDAQINVVADADMGEGVVEITGVLEVSVKAGAAASVAITAGTPEEKA